MDEQWVVKRTKAGTTEYRRGKGWVDSKADADTMDEECARGIVSAGNAKVDGHKYDHESV